MLQVSFWTFETFLLHYNESILHFIIETNDPQLKKLTQICTISTLVNKTIQSSQF